MKKELNVAFIDEVKAEIKAFAYALIDNISEGWICDTSDISDFTMEYLERFGEDASK